MHGAMIKTPTVWYCFIRLDIGKACRVFIKCIYFARCFLSKRKNVNYTFVFIQYVRIDGKNFAIRFMEDEKKMRKSLCVFFLRVCVCARAPGRVCLRACLYH